MRFLTYSPELADVEKVIVDGNACGRGLQLSHWPGNLTPSQYKADLSVEVVLRYIKSGNDPRKNFDLVTNDHFDTDGLLSVWAVLHPEEALRHEKALMNAAEAGDFYHFTSPEAVQFDYIVRAFEDSERSSFATQMAGLRCDANAQIITEALLARLPTLLHTTHRFRQLWQEPYGRLIAQFKSCNNQAMAVREWPEEHLTTIICPAKLGHYARNHFSSGHRILEANPSKDGTYFELFYREYLWYDIVSRAVTPRHILGECARELNSVERADGQWGITEWSPSLRFVAGAAVSEVRSDLRIGRRDPLGCSSLTVATVEGVIREALAKLDSQVRDEDSRS